MTGPDRAQLRVRSFWAVRKSESVRRTVSPKPLPPSPETPRSAAATPNAKTSSDWLCEPRCPTSFQTLMTDWCQAKTRRCDEGDASDEQHGLAYYASEERDGFTTPPPSSRRQDSGRRPSDSVEMTACCPAKRRRCEAGDASGELQGLACHASEKRDGFTTPPPSPRRQDSESCPLSDSVDYSNCLSTGCRPPSWCRAPARSRLAQDGIESPRAGQRKRVDPPLNFDCITI